MPIEAVLFDLDGTLVNFNLDFKTLRAEARGYLIRMGVPTSVLNVNESVFEMLKKTEIFFRNNDKSPEAFDEVRGQVFAITEKFEMEAASTTSLMIGAYDVLKELKQKNVKLGLCTTSSDKAAHYVLQRFRIDYFFQLIVARDKVKQVKPSTEQFELALKSLRVSPQAAVIVGDSVVDMQSAKELKAVAVGLTTGVSTLEQLKNYGANYIITSLNDLPILIKEINES